MDIIDDFIENTDADVVEEVFVEAVSACLRDQDDEELDRELELYIHQLETKTVDEELEAKVSEVIEPYFAKLVALHLAG